MKRLILILMTMATVYGASAQDKKVLVAYFSCTGTTEAVAKAIAEQTGGTLYRITPKQAYTAADLNWENPKSRSSVEMNDPKSRPMLADKKAKVEAYDVIYVGYPIWWGKCPTVVNTFMETYNFNGKTVIPFATSGGSSIANSVKVLKTLYNNKGIVWGEGKLLSGGAKQAAEWAITTK